MLGSTNSKKSVGFFTLISKSRAEVGMGLFPKSVVNAKSEKLKPIANPLVSDAPAFATNEAIPAINIEEPLHHSVNIWG